MLIGRIAYHFLKGEPADARRTLTKSMADILQDPRFIPGPDSPAWLAAMGDADIRAEKLEEYGTFLDSKRPPHHACGFIVDTLNPKLFDFQEAVTKWALRKGRAAIWGGCGVGKTAMFLEWADHVSMHTDKPILVFSPLAVALQTVREEAPKFGIQARYCKTAAEIGDGINVTNYERLDKFTDPSKFGAVILDESSILKSYTGRFRTEITEWAAGIRFRLCCTATPAPNDYVEIGTHAEFLGVMKRTEMLATFFVHDGGSTQDWRLKGHAEEAFWKWVASWAVAFRKPSDIGFDDRDFVLPPLKVETIVVDSPTMDGYLFPVEAKTLGEQRAAKRSSLEDRKAVVVELVESFDKNEPCIIWGQLNPETEAITRVIPGAVEVTGSDDPDVKQDRLIGFAERKFNHLITKVKIAGFGMNYQHCSKMIFAGVDHSWEAFYQAVRRCWRFGQVRPVTVWVIASEAERGVIRNLERKEKQAEEMMEGMIRHMKTEMQKELEGEAKATATVPLVDRSGKGWTMTNGDCVTGVSAMARDSVHYVIYSPPFGSLYTYSASENDMGIAAQMTSLRDTLTS